MIEFPDIQLVMNRRQVLSLTAAGAASQLVSTDRNNAQAATPKRALMKLGCQSGPTNEQALQFFKRHSVDGICGYPEDAGNKGYFSVEELSKTKDLCDKHKIALDCIAPPFLASAMSTAPNGPRSCWAKPERDRDIEAFQTIIKNCAKVGIRAMKYNMSLLGVLRTGRTPGRGGSTYSTWKLADAKNRSAATRPAAVNADDYWERITYFLERVVPVANSTRCGSPAIRTIPACRRRRISGRRCGARHRRRLEAVRRHQGEPVSRAQLLPGHRLGDAAGSRQGDLRRHPLVRQRARKSSTSTSATSAAAATTSQESYPDEGDVDL